MTGVYSPEDGHAVITGVTPAVSGELAGSVTTALSISGSYAYLTVYLSGMELCNITYHILTNGTIQANVVMAA